MEEYDINSEKVSIVVKQNMSQPKQSRRIEKRFNQLETLRQGQMKLRTTIGSKEFKVGS